ncbi:hypothetical protein EYF80_056988 [Liparis tanakae]|uniref:Uncharacterized protein n=1 Tax=Liparis tanakae TaxID=230148 RepID=A0A4Z2EVD3_9TELE|nr:hypothetical protein EYF80_056988 [Liparis tanakae]
MKLHGGPRCCGRWGVYSGEVELRAEEAPTGRTVAVPNTRTVAVPPSVSGLPPRQQEVVVAKRPQLRQAAQQATEALRAPSRSSGLGPTQPGQQVQDQLLHSLNAAGSL